MRHRTSALFGCVLLAGIAVSVGPLHGEERPNILLIMADDVGADAIGCYGGESFSTPEIDRIAAAGVRFEHCFSMPSCHPTRICLMTGRYPANVANPRWGSFPKELESQSIGQVMKRAGYATAVAGKWQIAMLGKDLQQPHRLGFDEYALFGWHEGPRYHSPLIWTNGKQMTGVANRYGPDVYSDFLIDFMKRNRHRPFFAYFPMALCHDVTDDLKSPVPYGSRGRYDSFREMMVEMDRIVGKMMKALDDLKLAKNTVVIFTGDNGTAARSIIRHENGKYIRDPVYVTYRGVRYQGGKTKLTDGGTHVPLLIRWPKTIRAGAVSTALVDFSDFLPTLADLTAAERIAQNDGLSFARALTDNASTGRPWAYAEAKGRFFVRDQRWKLYSDGRFFDVASDRLEQSPLKAELTAGAKQAKTRLEAAIASVIKRRKNRD